ncbi:MAG: zf-HC2 domain-containing protein [Acidobacteriota bacterium]
MACNRELLSGYLANQLSLEDQLDFLTHVDSCSHCWDEVYNATKSKHPHYYKSSSRQVKVSRQDLGEDEAFREEVFEVA